MKINTFKRKPGINGIQEDIYKEGGKM